MASTGTVSPGGSFGNGEGILTTGNLTLASSDATYSVDIDGAAPGSGYDQLTVIGIVNIQQAALRVNAYVPLAPGRS